MGFTLIPAAGLAEYALAITLVKALLLGTTIGDREPVDRLSPVSRRPTGSRAPAKLRRQLMRARSIGSRCGARSIVLVPVLMAFANPALYLPMIMKSVLLGQQGSVVSARTAGRELLGAILLAGLFSILFWFGLKICPNLWMFFLLMLLFGIYFAAKLYGIIGSRWSAAFWPDVISQQPPDPAGPGGGGQRERQGCLQGIRRPLHPVRCRHACTPGPPLAALEWLRGRRPGNPPRCRRPPDSRAPSRLGTSARDGTDHQRLAGGPGRPRACDAGKHREPRQAPQWGDTKLMEAALSSNANDSH